MIGIKMKKIRDFFKKLKNGLVGNKDEKIYEVRLWGINEEGFNNDEYNAWEIIKEIHQEVLRTSSIPFLEVCPDAPRSTP